MVRKAAKKVIGKKAMKKTRGGGNAVRMAGAGTGSGGEKRNQRAGYTIES